MRSMGFTVHYRNTGHWDICRRAELMHELIIAEGQKPIVIESWNV